MILLNRTSSGMAWIYSLVQPSRKKFLSTEHLKKRYLSSNTHSHHPQTALISWHCQVRLGGSGRHSHPTFSSTIHSEPQSCQVWERPAARKEIRTGNKEKQRPPFPWWIFMPFPLLFLKKKKKWLRVNNHTLFFWWNKSSVFSIYLFEKLYKESPLCARHHTKHWGNMILLIKLLTAAYTEHSLWATTSLVAQTIKCLPTMRETRVQSWVRKISWRRQWQSTSVFLPGKSHGWRSPVGYSPWGHKESDTTEQLYFTSLHESETSLSTLHEFIHPHNSSRAGITIISTFHMGKLSHIKVKHLKRNVDMSSRYL